MKATLQRRFDPPIEGMKATLQRRFDPPIEKCVHKTIMVAAAISSTNFLPTKSEMKSS
jgi:hypothetical protein